MRTPAPRESISEKRLEALRADPLPTSMIHKKSKFENAKSVPTLLGQLTAHLADPATSRTSPPPRSPIPGTQQFKEETIGGSCEKLIANQERNTFASLKWEAAKIEEASEEVKLRGKKRVASTTDHLSPVTVKKVLPNPLTSIPTFTGSARQSISTSVSKNTSHTNTPRLDEDSIPDLVIGQNLR